MRFDWLNSDIEAARRIFAGYDIPVNFVFNDPATSAEIEACEAILGVSFSPSYKDFLLLHNGACLFFDQADFRSYTDLNQFEQSEHYGLIIGCLDDIISETQERATGWSKYDEWINETVIFGFPLESNSLCAFEPNTDSNSEARVLDSDIEVIPYGWLEDVIAPSFEAWLRSVFRCVIEDGLGPYYWYVSGNSIEDFRFNFEFAKEQKERARNRKMP